jgi:hypothetical protein
MRRHLDNLKARPEHVRRRVAIGASAGVTGLIAVIWLAAHAATGTFALSTPGSRTTAGGAPDEASAPSEVTNARGEFSQLLGAVGESFGATSTKPGLSIVDGDTTSTIRPANSQQDQSDATSIPF